MCAQQQPNGWYVFDPVTKIEFDGPYPEKVDAERAAYALEHRLDILEEN